jgi:iron complex outermembrane receptor protein
MNTHFQGVKLDVDYGMYQHHNHQDNLSALEGTYGFAPTDSSVDSGFTKQLSFIAGSNFADGAGNATMYATYNNEAAVAQRPFDYSACTLAGALVNAKTKLTCGGSSTNATGRFIGYNANNDRIINSTVDGTTGQLRPFNSATDLYNFGALNFYQRPNERWTGGAFMDYDVNSHVNVYTEFMFTRNTSTSQNSARLPISRHKHQVLPPTPSRWRTSTVATLRAAAVRKRLRPPRTAASSASRATSAMPGGTMRSEVSTPSRASRPT